MTFDILHSELLICRGCSNWGQRMPLRFPAAAMDLVGNAASYRVFAERGNVRIGCIFKEGGCVEDQPQRASPPKAQVFTHSENGI